MQTFLDDVAKIITASQDELNRIKVIVPTIRAIDFLKSALKKQIDIPQFAPQIISVEQFISELSGLKKISKIDLISSFYSIYQEIAPKKEQDSLNEFFAWAPSLLQEFNEIDAQLVDPKSIFAFMGAVDKIENWQKETRDLLGKHSVEFQSKVPNYYNRLYSKLLEEQKGYSGMHYREAVRNLGFYLESDLPSHFFVGFNALTHAEETIFQELIAEGKAEIIWDIDLEFFEDSLHSAAYFIRSYFNNWNVLKRKKKQEFSNHFSKPKTIEIIGAVKNVSQAQIAVELATKICKEYPNESTVLVLGDENLLHPTLAVLPHEEIPWNVTMGYPLRDTTLFSFYSNYLEW